MVVPGGEHTLGGIAGEAVSETTDPDPAEGAREGEATGPAHEAAIRPDPPLHHRGRDVRTRRVSVAWSTIEATISTLRPHRRHTGRRRQPHVVRSRRRLQMKLQRFLHRLPHSRRVMRTGQQQHVDHRSDLLGHLCVGELGHDRLTDARRVRIAEGDEGQGQLVLDLRAPAATREALANETVDVLKRHLNEVGDGARRVGLVDGIGHLVPTMKERYGDKVRFIDYHRRKPFLARIGLSLVDEAAAAVAERVAFARYGL